MKNLNYLINPIPFYIDGHGFELHGAYLRQ